MELDKALDFLDIGKLATTGMYANKTRNSFTVFEPNTKSTF